MGKPDSVEAKLLRWTLGDAVDQFAPITAYGMLFTVNPDDASAGFTEVSGGGYARVALAGKFGTLSSITNGSAVANTAKISWPAATASWGTIAGWGIIDALTGAGTVGIVRIIPLTVQKVVSNLDVFSFEIGQAVLRED